MSGGYDGSIMFWIVGNKDPQGKIPQAHDSTVWDLAWHPIGHVLCSGSNDNTTKFWARNKPVCIISIYGIFLTKLGR